MPTFRETRTLPARLKLRMKTQNAGINLVPALISALGVILLAPTIHAQRPEGNPIPSQAERLEKMAEHLQLSPEQKSKIKAVMDKSGPEIRDIMAKGRQNASETERAKVRDLLKTQSEDIAAILTPEQREKFKQTREQRTTQPSAEERLQRMTSTLSLSSEQQSKVKAIMETHAPKLRELMAKGRDNATETDRERFKELMKQQFEEIGAILTPEQKSKFREIREKRTEQPAK